MKQLLIILLSSVFVNNYVLTKFLGICPFLGVSKKIDQATGMGVAVTAVMLVATAVTYPIYTFLLYPNYTYLETVVFILVIAALVQFVEMVLKRYIPPLYRSLGVYLPLITTNCAVLGVCLNNITDGYNFIESIVSSLGVGLGFMLAMVLFAGVRGKMEGADVPKPFRGIPITLIAASIVSMSFYGFASVIENMFK